MTEKPSPAARRTILIVDDEPDIIDALRRTLRGADLRLLGATSGELALRVIEAVPVDLLISDIDMPAMSGLELVARVRKTHPHIVRLILTGVASLGSALRAINEGEVHRFLTKPWDKDELRAAVREGLAKRVAPRTTVPIDPALAKSASQLSPRLRQTLAALLTGASEKEVASELGVSPHTAHQYVKTLYRHFGVGSRAQFMVKLEPLRQSEEPEGTPEKPDASPTAKGGA